MKVKVNFPGHVAHGKIYDAYRWKSHKNSPPCEGWALTHNGCDYVLPYELCRVVMTPESSTAEPFGPIVEGYFIRG